MSIQIVGGALGFSPHQAGRDPEKGARPPLLPWFAVAFGVLVAVNSLIALPTPFQNFAGKLSRFGLVVAIAAIGMRTSLKELAART